MGKTGREAYLVVIGNDAHTNTSLMGLDDSVGCVVVGDSEHTDIQRLFGIAQCLDKIAKAVLGWEEDGANKHTVVRLVVILLMVLNDMASQMMVRREWWGRRGLVSVTTRFLDDDRLEPRNLYPTKRERLSAIAPTMGIMTQLK
jgi:hypothetical protein